MKPILLVAAIVTIGCSSESKMPAPVDRKVDFTADVQPIFQNHCLGCHGAKKQQGKYRLDDKEIALKAEAVKPGDSAGSGMIQHVLGINDRKRMPPQPPHLTDEQVGILRAWIDQGAIWPEPAKKTE